MARDPFHARRRVWSLLGAGAVAVAAFGIWPYPDESARALGVKECSLPGARVVYRQWAVFVLRSADPQPKYYGCLANVGRHFRLSPATAPSSTRPRLAAVDGSWLAFEKRAVGTGGASPRLVAVNLRTGQRSRAPAQPENAAQVPGSVLALIVSREGSLAWIASRGRERTLRMRAARASSSTLVHASAEIGSLLSLEDSRCAFTWMLAGTQRSSTLPCDHP